LTSYTAGRDSRISCDDVSRVTHGNISKRTANRPTCTYTWQHVKRMFA